MIGAKAIHLQTADERNHVLDHDELAIDVGAKDKKDAEKLVSPGDLISFESKWVEFGDGMVKARAMDDRIGCAVAMSILEGDYPCDVTCVFTVNEEIGQTGAAAGAFSVRPDAALILEATGANDLACEDEHLKVCRLKKGVAVSLMVMRRSAIAICIANCTISRWKKRFRGSRSSSFPEATIPQRSSARSAQDRFAC